MFCGNELFFKKYACVVLSFIFIIIIMPNNSSPKWNHPSEVMKLHKFKQKKNVLQARIKSIYFKSTSTDGKDNENKSSIFDAVFSAKKRNNPFIKNDQLKKSKTEPSLEESSDQTLFKLFNQNVILTSNNSLTSFKNVLSINEEKEVHDDIQIVKAKGEKWLPIDWTLKSKMRLLSTKPFPWNQKLKISEEASGITAFTRCLDKNSETTLDTSPNAKFYQCCLYWQQPALPWLTLFPRNNQKSPGSPTNNVINSTVKESLQKSWSDSLRSLFQLVRTGQCPYFYACANNFTILFRAAGICGFSDIHVLITPTTRGFRQVLKDDDIEFKMPLKTQSGCDEDEVPSNVNNLEQDETDEDWLTSLGVNKEDIKQINNTQDKKTYKLECEVDNSEQSLVLIEGVEVHSFYNFLINCKSIIALTGPLAGVPPTLLSPVAFHGATLNSLKVRDSKVHIENTDYYSLELCGPILPHTIHNLFTLNSPDQCLTATFSNLKATEAFSKSRSNERKSDISSKSCMVFRKENLSDCGLLPKVLKHFCSLDQNYVTSIECLKYLSENETYTWT